jgi:hypothetical protein
LVWRPAFESAYCRLDDAQALPARVDAALDLAVEQIIYHSHVFTGASHQSRQVLRQENQAAHSDRPTQAR